MKSDRPENLSPEAVEVGQRYSRLPPEAQREIVALLDALSRDADSDAIDVILEQRKRGDITGLEATKKFELLRGRSS